MRLAPLVACVLAGCMGLGPRPDRSRFFTLAPLGSDEMVAAPPGAPELSLGLGPIVFPAYLDRMWIVRRTGANEVAISATDRWAEPLGDTFRTTLQQNLVTLLGTPRVVLHPWQRTARPAFAVDVEVLRFEPAANGDAELAAAWHVVRLADGAVLVGRTSRIAERAGGGDTDAAVAALSRALGALSREIATAVRAEQAAGHERPLTRPRA
jgi:uncharacterized lipoprotein YmbA